MRFTTNLFRRGGVFYYRARIPVDLRHCFKRQEIWLSLRTSDRQAAELALSEVHARQLKKYASLRSGVNLTCTSVASPSTEIISLHRTSVELTVQDLLSYWTKQSVKRPRTLMDANKAVQRLIAVSNKVSAADIDKKIAIAYKDSLLAEGLAHATVVKNLGLVKSIFEIASNNALIGINPFSDVKLFKPTRQEKSRIPFSEEDLERIFASPVYSMNARPLGGAEDAAYWLPLIALTTGMRLEEIGQLTSDEIKCEEEIWFFDLIHDPDNGKTLKNVASCRRVPIHEVLIECGILDLLKEQLSKGQKRLFPRLVSAGHRQLTASWSQWFGRYLRQVVGISDKRKTFHSFRHTFKDICRASEIPKELHDRITGHASSDVGDGYGSSFYPLKPLHVAISKMKLKGSISNLVMKK